MRQEGTNTFSEGLIYDLNPLTVPNNLLTDCVNGTFVTFNGDEMALQNDGGNAVVKYNMGSTRNPNWVDVSLSPGFYPIGIKEYGGVLYIVSACNKDSIEEWDVEKDYYLDDIVRLGKFDYYKCIKDVKSSPNSDLINWKKIDGNELERIELGTYPSPVQLIPNKKGKTSIPYNIDSPQQLYIPSTINDDKFQAGTYIVFNTEPGTDVSNVSYYKYENGIKTYIKKAYKISLLQQLTNGYVDLTSSVWDKYYDYKSIPINLDETDIEFWFSDSNFKYYCPNTFKGKPTISTEIETLKSFKILSSVINVKDNYYYITTKVQLENDNTLDINEVSFYYWVNEDTPKFIDSDSKSVINSDNEITITLKLPIAQYQNKNSILNYEIRPVIKYNNKEISAEILEEYCIRNKYILGGSKALSTNMDNLNLFKSTKSGDYTCILENNVFTGDAQFLKLILQNKFGQNLNNQLDITEDEYYFEYVEDEYQIFDEDDYRLGFYKNDPNENKRALFVNWASNYSEINNNVSSRNEIVSLINQQLIITEYSQCSGVKLTINTNKKLYSEHNSRVLVVVDNSQSQVLYAPTEGSNTFTFLIPTNRKFYVYVQYVTKRIYDNLSETITLSGEHSGILEDSEINFAIINSLKLYASGNKNYPFVYRYKAYVNTPGTLSPYYDPNYDNYEMEQSPGRTCTWKYSDVPGSMYPNTFELVSNSKNSNHYYNVSTHKDENNKRDEVLCLSSTGKEKLNFKFPSGWISDLDKTYININDNNKYCYVFAQFGEWPSNEFEIFLREQKDVTPIIID